MILKKKAGRKPKSVLTIGIDCGALSMTNPQQQGGVYTLTYNFLWELPFVDTRNNYLLYSFAPIKKEIINRFKGRGVNRVLKPAFGYKTIRLPLALKLDNLDIFLALNQATPKTPIPTVGVIYDLAFLKYSDFYKDFQRLKNNTDELVERAKKIITISEASKQDIIKTYNYSEEKIQVSLPGVSAHFKPHGPRYIGHLPYFLYVGHLKKTKNIPLLIKAFADFLHKNNMKYQLVLVGSDQDLDPEIPFLIDVLQLKKYVQIRGHVSYKDLPKYYRGAIAFVSPALYEGFGLPIVEAMACGCPVIVANNSSMPEIVGKVGIIIDAENIRTITQALLEISVNQVLRKKMIRNGIIQSKQFSWKNFTRKITKELRNF